jgi:hypothetical protein
MTEKIKMLEYRFNWFPARFSWRGREYQIDAVNECKTEAAEYHFWVRCEGTMLHLSHAAQSNRWALHWEQEGAYAAGITVV